MRAKGAFHRNMSANIFRSTKGQTGVKPKNCGKKQKWPQGGQDRSWQASFTAVSSEATKLRSKHWAATLNPKLVRQHHVAITTKKFQINHCSSTCYHMKRRFFISETLSVAKYDALKPLAIHMSLAAEWLMPCSALAALMYSLRASLNSPGV